MTRVLWSVTDIQTAEPAARKLLLKAPTRLICPETVGIIVHPCGPKGDPEEEGLSLFLPFDKKCFMGMNVCE